MSDELVITKENVDDTRVRFILQGRVNSLDANKLQFQLEGALDSKKKQIVVNMLQVGYLVSTGIRVLLSAYKKAKQYGGEFYIEHPSENVKNVLGMTALDEMLLK